MFTIVDRFLKYVTFLPCSTNNTAIDLVLLFYNNIVCKFGTPVKLLVIGIVGSYQTAGNL